LVKEGGKIKLYVPSDLAYGDYEQPGIPAYSTLIFDVTVVKVIKK
jgi:FKBP-type peptidyl-prolyl cis-trans isomerase